MKTYPLVHIVTLNWNHLNDTCSFLISANQLDYPNYQIVMVDNGSTENPIPTIEEQFPSVVCIRNAQNLGFSGGVNTGIRYALEHETDFVFLANNDTFMATDMLSLLVDAAQEEKVGLVSPKILYAAPPHPIWSVGAQRNKLTLEIAGCRRGQADTNLNEKPFPVDFVTACGVLIKRQCIEDIGLFDERFFMYYEDSDYALRAQLAGYKMVVVPKAKMWHHVAVSSGGGDSPNERYWMALSSIQFVRKHIHGWRWLVIIPYRLGSALKTMIRLLVNKQTDAAKAYLRGLKDGLAK